MSGKSGKIRCSRWFSCDEASQAGLSSQSEGMKLVTVLRDSDHLSYCLISSLAYVLVLLPKRGGTKD